MTRGESGVVEDAALPLLRSPERFGDCGGGGSFGGGGEADGERETFEITTVPNPGDPGLESFLRGDPGLKSCFKGDPALWSCISGDPGLKSCFKGDPGVWSFIKGESTF